MATHQSVRGASSKWISLVIGLYFCFGNAVATAQQVKPIKVVPIKKFAKKISRKNAKRKKENETTQLKNLRLLEKKLALQLKDIVQTISAANIRAAAAQQAMDVAKLPLDAARNLVESAKSDLQSAVADRNKLKSELEAEQPTDSPFGKARLEYLAAKESLQEAQQNAREAAKKQGAKVVEEAQMNLEQATPLYLSERKKLFESNSQLENATQQISRLRSDLKGAEKELKSKTGVYYKAKSNYTKVQTEISNFTQLQLALSAQQQAVKKLLPKKKTQNKTGTKKKTAKKKKKG